MFIQTESTPNPATLKFIPGCVVLGPGHVADFPTALDAARSPLAQDLFDTGAVARVFFGSDFVSVTRKEGDWADLKPLFLALIAEHLAEGGPLSVSHEDVPATAEDTEVVAQIKEILETRVRPGLAADGGDVVFQGFEEASGTVFLHLRGACAGCPSATQTLKGGIERLLTHYVPEVNRVEQV